MDMASFEPFAPCELGRLLVEGYLLAAFADPE
jgi:hypothetical protein